MRLLFKVNDICGMLTMITTYQGTLASFGSDQNKNIGYLHGKLEKCIHIKKQE